MDCSDEQDIILRRLWSASVNHHIEYTTRKLNFSKQAIAKIHADHAIVFDKPEKTLPEHQPVTMRYH